MLNLKKRLVLSYKNNDFPQAQQLAEQVISMNAQDYEALFYLANIRLHQRHFQSALSLFEKIISNYPEKYQGYEGIAKIYKQQGLPDYELEQWQIVAKKFPNLAHAQRNIATLLLHKGSFSQAESVYHGMIKQFPTTHDGYAGIATIAEKQLQWQNALTLWANVLKRFPKLLNAHLHFIPIYIRLHGFESAEPLFQKANQLFPNTEKLDQLYAIEAEKRFYWHQAASAWLRLSEKFQDNTFFQYRYGKALRHTQNLNTAITYFENAISRQPETYLLLKGLLECALAAQNWTDSIHYGEKIQKLTITPTQSIEIYFIQRIAYQKLKRLNELEAIFHNFTLNYPYEYLAHKGYAIIAELKYDGDITVMEQACDRWRQATIHCPNTLEAHLKYGELLLTTNQLTHAEQLFSSLKHQNANNFDAWRGWCLAAHHQKNWDEARKRFLQTRLKFPSQFNNIYYYFLNTLIRLNAMREIDNSYLWHLKSRFKDNISAHPEQYLSLAQINIARIKGDYNQVHYLVDKLSGILPFSLVTTLPKPEENNILRYIEHSPENKTLVVCFSGMDGKRTVEYYKKYGLNHLENIIHNNADTYNYTGFANKTPKYNFLLLRDNYNSWYQIHTEQYIDIIKRYIDTHQINKLVMIGASAGGFAALMFGQLLSADIVYTQAPQILAFTNYSTHFNKALEIEYNLTAGKYTDIAYLQQRNNGFIPNTYINACENNGTDVYALSMLNQQDSNLHIRLYSGDTHSVHQVIGKSAMFRELCNIIDTTPTKKKDNYEA